MRAAEYISDLRVLGPPAGGPVIVEGTLSEKNASEFELLLRRLAVGGGRAITLDLGGLDIEDGIAAATAVNSIRELCSRASRVVLKRAPQMLCHNLYRVGMLEGAVELVEMRHDEPAGY